MILGSGAEGSRLTRNLRNRTPSALPEQAGFWLLLLECPGVQRRAPLAALVHKHVFPVAAKFFTPSIGVPAPISIAELALLLASLHGDLIALEAPLNEACKQLLSAFRPGDLLASGWE